MYNTFNGWKRAGRAVALGERGMYRNEYGDMMYHRAQTVKRGSSVRIEYDRYGYPIRKVTTYF